MTARKDSADSDEQSNASLGQEGVPADPTNTEKVREDGPQPVDDEWVDVLIHPGHPNASKAARVLLDKAEAGGHDVERHVQTTSDGFRVPAKLHKAAQSELGKLDD